LLFISQKEQNPKLKKKHRMQREIVA